MRVGRTIRIWIINSTPSPGAALLGRAGAAAFFSSMAEIYAPMAARAGVVSDAKAERWLDAQRRASERGTFSGACNYYAYLARPPA